MLVFLLKNFNYCSMFNSFVPYKIIYKKNKITNSLLLNFLEIKVLKSKHYKLSTKNNSLLFKKFNNYLNCVTISDNYNIFNKKIFFYKFENFNTPITADVKFYNNSTHFDSTGFVINDIIGKDILINNFNDKKEFSRKVKIL